MKVVATLGKFWHDGIALQRRVGAPKLIRITFAMLVLAVFSTALGIGEMEWPVSGNVTSHSGERWGEEHNGLDIDNNIGETVYAPYDGVVTRVFFDEAGGGNVVTIEHPGGYTTQYLHLNSSSVQVGDTVTQGQAFAETGNTAKSGQPGEPHLHFEIWGPDGGRVYMPDGRPWDEGITSMQQGQPIPVNFPGLEEGESAENTPGEEATYTVSRCADTKNSNPDKLCQGGDNRWKKQESITLSQDQVDNAANLCTNFEEVVECGGNPEEGYFSLADINIQPDTVAEEPERLCSKRENGKREYIPCSEAGLDKSYLDFLTPDAKQWFQRTVDFVEGERPYSGSGPNMFKVLRDVAWALTFALFVYAIANANYFYRQDEYWQILGRLIIAVGLIAGSSSISGSLQNQWENLHDFSQEEFAASSNESLDSAIKAMGASIPSFLLGMVAMDKLNALSEGGFTGLILDSAGELNANRWVKRLGQILRFLLLVLMSMYGLHVVTIYATGLVIIFAMLFLPITASLLLWPGMGSYLTRWASMTLTAYASLVVGIIVYAMAMDLAFAIPLENLGNQFNEIGAQAQTAFNQAQGDLNANSTIGESIAQSSKGVLDAVPNLIVGGTQTLILFLFNAIFIVVGMFMGLYLLINFESFVAGFFGGVASSGAQSLSGAASGALGGMLVSKFDKESGAGVPGGGGGGGNPALESGNSLTASAGRDRSSGGGGDGEAKNNIQSFQRRGSPTSGGSGGVGEAAGEAAEAAAVVV